MRICFVVQKCFDAKGVNRAAWEREIDPVPAGTALYGIEPPKWHRLIDRSGALLKPNVGFGL